MKALMFVLTIALVGCTASQGADDVSGSGGAAEVKLVTLDDGTRCAVLVGYEKGSISCDWHDASNTKSVKTNKVGGG